MSQAKKKPILELSVLAIMAVLFGITYFNFAKYQPKIMRKLEEVKGYRKPVDTDIMYPEDAEKIAMSQTGQSTQATFRTNKSQDEVVSFYKYVFLDREWEIESIKQDKTSLIFRFKKPGKLASVISQKQDVGQIVSVEITKN